ncbi:MAG: DUF2628 domain-containing protein [Alphaproteobacteria bacterium]|nr:DUF2628 domain-containing protein [Alphaproteobacteria bacterium]
MRTYTIHLPPDRRAADAILVPEGFAWWAVAFGPLWFLWQGLWASAIGLALLQTGLTMAAEALVGPGAATVPALGLALLVGFTARDWRRWRLERRGWRLADVRIAPSADAAELNWFAARFVPSQAAGPAPVAGAPA